MAAIINTAMQSDIQLRAGEIDFINRFSDTWKALRAIMGITRPIRKELGAKLVSSRVSMVPQSGSVAFGETLGGGRYLRRWDRVWQRQADGHSGEGMSGPHLMYEQYVSSGGTVELSAFPLPERRARAKLDAWKKTVLHDCFWAVEQTRGQSGQEVSEGASYLMRATGRTWSGKRTWRASRSPPETISSREKRRRRLRRGPFRAWWSGTVRMPLSSEGLRTTQKGRRRTINWRAYER